jgi:hypothetical protein
VEKFQILLKPLESLKGLKSAVVQGKVTEAYGVELKKITESNSTNLHEKWKPEPDGEDKAVVKPKRKPQTKRKK